MRNAMTANPTMSKTAFILVPLRPDAAKGLRGGVRELVWPYTTNKRSVCVWRHTTKTDPGDRAPAGAGTSAQDGLTRGDGHGPLKPHPSVAPSANDRVAEKF